MNAPRATITVPEVLPLVQALYRRHEAGCCLHLVLDDGNVDDDSVAYCETYAHEQGCKECIHIARLLAQMSYMQRAKLHRKAKP